VMDCKTWIRDLPEAGIFQQGFQALHSLTGSTHVDRGRRMVPIPVRGYFGRADKIPRMEGTAVQILDAAGDAELPRRSGISPITSASAQVFLGAKDRQKMIFRSSRRFHLLMYSMVVTDALFHLHQLRVSRAIR